MFGEIMLIFFLLLGNMKTYLFTVEMNTAVPTNPSVSLLLGNVGDSGKVKLEELDNFPRITCLPAFLSPGMGMSMRTLVCSPSRMFKTSVAGGQVPSEFCRVLETSDISQAPVLEY